MAMKEEQRVIRLDQAKKQLDDFAWLMDKAFKVPGLNWRFGLEAIIGLVPWAGDFVSGALGLFLLIKASQFKIPGVVMARMILNTVIDITVGAIPFVGDLFDFVWKSNTRNMELFRQYAEVPETSTRKHWMFILGLISGFAVLVFILALVIAFILREVLQWLGV